MRRISAFDPASLRIQIAAEVATSAGQSGLDRCAQFAVAAARLAVQDAGLDMANRPAGG